MAGYKNRDEREKIGFLRAKAISDLVKDLAAAFLENEKNILNGKLEKDLISMIKKSKPLQEIYSQSISKIYRSRVVVEREVAQGEYTAQNTLYPAEPFCDETGEEYTFTINDSYGDGICCAYGSGSYTILHDGAQVVSGGAFTSTITHTFGGVPATPPPSPPPTTLPPTVSY